MAHKNYHTYEKLSQTMDTESQIPKKKTNTHHYVRAGRVPLPLRRKHIFIDVLSIVLCLTLTA